MTEELTEKNGVIDNMRGINKELNGRLCEVMREWGVRRQGEREG